MKINTLTLHNFLSWKEGNITFHPKITAIIGAGNSGKTTLLRALAWCCTNNQPTPEESIFGKDIDVSLTIDDNKIIHREKGSKNTVTFGDTQYDKFGALLPDDVVQYSQLLPEHFAFQHDPPFLIGMHAPTEVYKKLSKPLGGDIFVDASTLVRKEKEGLAKEINTIAKVKSQTDERADSLQDIVLIRAHFATAQELYSSIQALEQQKILCTELYNILIEINKLKSICCKLENYLTTAATLIATVAQGINTSLLIQKSLNASNAITILQQGIAMLDYKVVTATTAMKEINVLTTKQWLGTSFAKLLSAIEGQENKLAKYTTALKLAQDALGAFVAVRGVLRDYVEAKKGIQGTTEAIAAIEQERDAAAAVLQSVDMCPLCGQSMKGCYE